MKEYSGVISLVKNSRGIYCLDTTMGCESGMKTKGGCYSDCYAARSAKTYGYDFSKTVLRKFINRQHQLETVLLISKIKMDFVRIGCSGDPSENWGHTLSICKAISNCNKQIVIITKHFNNLSDLQLSFLNTINVCINTSVSALDNSELLHNSIEQYERLKPYCKSVLRIVSCDFNLENSEGNRMAEIQRRLFKHSDVIDTVFRPSKKNLLVTDGIVNVTTGNFNGNKQLMSKLNKKTFTGKCAGCKEMCGVNIGEYKNRIPLVKQTKLFIYGKAI